MHNTDHHIEAVHAIQKKLLGKRLSYREIYTIMDEIAHKRLGNVLTTYFVASSFKEGFSPDELFHFTKAMVDTGTKLHFDGIVADKHSTGGVAGTRTTMIVVPIVAEAGFIIPKTSSRAITSPAGTADVIETLAHSNFTPQQVVTIVEKTGGCMIWNGHLGVAPADDFIIKVEEPLMFESFDKIIVSVMAKKIAMSTNHLILDIPVGKTMKIKHFSDAEKIAKKFVDLGKRFGIRVVADVNETHQPAGRGIGPILEARDVLYVLEQKTDRPMKLEERALRLAGKLLDICYEDAHINKNGEEEAARILRTGKALRKFQEIIHAQGGKAAITSSSLPIKAHTKQVCSLKRGRIKSINNYNLNTLAKILGAPQDIYAGLYLHKRLDEMAGKNECIMTLYSSDRYKLQEAELTYQNFPIYDIE